MNSAPITNSMPKNSTKLPARPIPKTPGDVGLRQFPYVRFCSDLAALAMSPPPDHSGTRGQGSPASVVAAPCPPVAGSTIGKMIRTRAGRSSDISNRITAPRNCCSVVMT